MDLPVIPKSYPFRCGELSKAKFLIVPKSGLIFEPLGVVCPFIGGKKEPFWFFISIFGRFV